MTGGYLSVTRLPGINVEGDLEFLNQNCRGWGTYRRSGNLQMLHHHASELYRLVCNHRRHRPFQTIHTINLNLSNNTLSLVTVDVIGIGNATGSTKRTGEGEET